MKEAVHKMSASFFGRERGLLHDLLVAYAKCIQSAERTIEKYRILARKENRNLTEEEAKSVKKLEKQVYQSYKYLENYYKDSATSEL